MSRAKRFCAFVIPWVIIFESRATPILYDSFNYSPPGAQLSTAGTPAWTLRNAGQVDPTVAAGSLSYPGLATASDDNSVALNGAQPPNGVSGISGRVFGQIYDPTNTQTLYYSLTLRVTSITAGDWGGSGNFLNGSFMLGFSEATTGGVNAPNAGAPLLIRTGDPTNASGMADDFQGFQLGTGVTAATAAPNSRTFDGTRVYSPNATLFLVLSYTFGPGTGDDVARLWVNPVPGTLESANTPVVTATSTTDIANNRIQSFFLRNNSVEPTITIIDDLRVGTAWEDVTPIPEPTSFGLLAAAAAVVLTRRPRGGNGRK